MTIEKGSHKTSLINFSNRKKKKKTSRSVIPSHTARLQSIFPLKPLMAAPSPTEEDRRRLNRDA